MVEVSREEHRRAEILTEVATALHGTPDVDAVVEAIADRLRLLLRTRLVSVLLRREGPFELRAVSAETPQLATSFRARHDRQTIRFATDLAQRAVSAGEAITVSVSGDQHSLGSVISPGMLIAAPFRTSRTEGAILVYPRPDGGFTAEERSLVSAIAGFGAVALAHAELCSTAQGQARELHQLLEISSELSSSGDLDHFLQAFVVRASDFLSFGRCFIALLEDEQFHIRHSVTRGESQRVDNIFPEGIATRALRAKEVFCSNDLGQEAGANLQAIATYKARQLLAVPLLSADGSVLGMFGVLDRVDDTGISREDIRRARALAAQVSVVLEVAHNLPPIRTQPPALRRIDPAGARNRRPAAPARFRSQVCQSCRRIDGSAGRCPGFISGWTIPDRCAPSPAGRAASRIRGTASPRPPNQDHSVHDRLDYDHLNYDPLNHDSRHPSPFHPGLQP